jgi:hypothetical protein
MPVAWVVHASLRMPLVGHADKLHAPGDGRT